MEPPSAGPHARWCGEDGQQTSTGKIEEYTWDHRNRLTKVVFRNTSGGAIVKQVDYEYDAYNRLVRRTFDADGAGAGAATNQYWVYDEGINAVLQFDGSLASNLSHRYLWSDNVDELLADEQLSGSNTLWGLADHLGSLRDIADYIESTSVTTITNHRTTNSFGKLISETNTSVDLIFAFTGKQSDEVTGLQHNLNRWLDPTIGQWLSEDPIGFSAGDYNVKRYVGNRVTSEFDPDGLITQDPPEKKGHKKNIQEKNRETHEGGDRRRDMDGGNEKGDERRDVPRKRPDNHKGPWPPKQNSPPTKKENPPDAPNIPFVPNSDSPSPIPPFPTPPTVNPTIPGNPTPPTPSILPRFFPFYFFPTRILPFIVPNIPLDPNGLG